LTDNNERESLENATGNKYIVVELEEFDIHGRPLD